MSESCEELSVELSALDELSVLELVAEVRDEADSEAAADLEVAASEGGCCRWSFLQCPFSCLRIVPLSGRSRHLSWGEHEGGRERCHAHFPT